MAIGGPVAVSGGIASVSHTFTATGTHDITAEYSGVAGFGASNSQISTVTVALVQQNTTTVLSAPVAASTSAAVDLTAVVSPTPSSGTIQFKDGAANIGSAVAVVNGSATLSHQSPPTVHTASRPCTPAVQNSAARSRHPRP